MAAKKMLFETLMDLSFEELDEFKSVIQLEEGFPRSSKSRLKVANRQDIAELMVEVYGERCVELTNKVLKKMNRTDLVQRLSGTKEKQWPSLIQTVKTMAAKKMLFETLTDLSSEELDEFKSLIQLKEGFPRSSKSRLKVANTQDIAELMVEVYGRRCVELTNKVLKKMNRTDLVQRLSGTKEKQWPSLSQRVETMASVIELLLETLAGLSHRQVKKFKEVQSQRYERYERHRWIWLKMYDMSDLSLSDFHRNFPDIPSLLLQTTDKQDLVFLMVLTYGQRSVEETKEVLKEMNETDLVQRLSESRSRPKKKPSVDEHLSALIHKVATMTAVKELLLETLKDLNSEEMKNFKLLLQFTFFQKGLPLVSWTLLKTSWPETLVSMMVETCGQQSVEVTREVFMDMNRTDLVQRLSETSSRPKEKHSVDEHCPALIQKVETMASVIELLLETLAGLSDEEFKRYERYERYKRYERYEQYERYETSWPLETTDKQHFVFLLVLTYGQQSVEETQEVLKRMNRTDLVQRLSDSSSGHKKKHSADKHRSALIQKVATMAAVKQLLLETLNDLSNEGLEKFTEYLQLTFHQRDLPDVSSMLLHRTDKVKIVDLMVQTCGQRSVEVTREVFMDMKRTDLVQRLSKPSSGLKEKHSVDEHRPTLSEKAAAMAAVKQILLETLKDLSLNELKKFKWLLPFTYFQKSLPQISWSKLDWVDSVDLLVDMMVKNQQSVEVTKEVLMDMNRTDLVKRLSETSSGLKGPSRSLELGGCGSIMQDSSNWTKLEPEVDITDAAAPTYSLQSEAGNFECSVSGLRWVCKEQVSFKFQFCSWGNHMERMESIRYMPAGPLMDISVIAEKFDEVYLPHWICIDDNPKILDKFAVLHIDDCGDVVEKVAEVTPSHVKLSEPAFSLKGVLMKVGFPVKISCNMLIYYKPNTPFLKLHVYLIPHDPGLQQTVDKKEFSEGYKIIQKPRPDRYLKMQDGFILTADIDTAKVLPEKITLRHDSQDPNFYEVFIKNPDRDFPLTLLHTNKNKGKQYEEVWTCEIRKDDHHNSAHSEAAESLGPCYGATASEKQCVDEHLPALMQKAATITTDRERFLKTLEYLKEEELKKFKWFLQDSDLLAGLPCVPSSRLEMKDRVDLVDLMMQTYSEQALEVAKKIFKKIDRNDLVQRF